MVAFESSRDVIFWVSTSFWVKTIVETLCWSLKILDSDVKGFTGSQVFFTVFDWIFVKFLIQEFVVVDTL